MADIPLNVIGTAEVSSLVAGMTQADAAIAKSGFTIQKFSESLVELDNGSKVATKAFQAIAKDGKTAEVQIKEFNSTVNGQLTTTIDTTTKLTETMQSLQRAREDALKKGGFKLETPPADATQSTMLKLEEAYNRVVTAAAKVNESNAGLANALKIVRDNNLALVGSIDSDLVAALRKYIIAQDSATASSAKAKDALDKQRAAADQLALKEKLTKADVPIIPTPAASIPALASLQAALEKVREEASKAGVGGALLRQLFDEAKNSATGLANTIYSDLNTALQKLVIAQQRAEESAKKLADTQGAASFKGTLGTFGANLPALPILPGVAAPTGIPTTEAMLDVEKAVRAVGKVFQDTTISAKDLTAAYIAFRDSGDKGGFNEARIKSFQDLKKAQEAAAESAKSIDERRKKAQEDVNNALKEVGLTQSRLNTIFSQSGNIEQQQRIRNEINALTDALIKGTINAGHLRTAMEALRSKTAPVGMGGEEAAATKMLGALKVEADKSTKTFLNVTESIRAMNATIVKRIPSALWDWFKEGIVDAVAFERAVLKVMVAIDRIEGPAGRLATSLNALSREFGQTRKDVAEAAYQVFASNIVKAEDAVSVLNTALTLSRTTFGDTEIAARTLTETIAIYNLTVADQAKVSGLLFATNVATRTSLTDLSRVIDNTSVQARSLGLSLEETLGSFTSLRTSGNSVQKSITTLTNIFNRLLVTGGAVSEIFGKEFTSAADAIKAIGFENVLKRIAQEAEGGTGRAKEFAQQLLGTDANISKLTESIKLLREESKKQGTVNAEIIKSFQEQARRTRATWNVIWASLGEGFLVAIDDILESFRDNFSESWRDVLGRSTKDLAALSLATSVAMNKVTADIAVTNDSFRGMQSSVLEALGKIRGGVTNTFALLRRDSQLSTTDVVETFKDMNEVIKAITTSTNNFVKEQTKFGFDVLEKFDQKSFENRIKSLPPQDQAPLLDQRRIELEERRLELLKLGTIPAQQQANKLLQEEIALYDRITELNNQIAKTNQTRAAQAAKLAQATFKGFDKESSKLRDKQAIGGKIDPQQIKNLQKLADIAAKDNQQRIAADPVLRANLQNEEFMRRLILEHIKLTAEGSVAAQIKLRETAVEADIKQKKDKEAAEAALAAAEKAKNVLVEQKGTFGPKQTDALTELDAAITAAKKESGTLRGVRSGINIEKTRDIGELHDAADKATKQIFAAMKEPTVSNINIALEQARESLSKFTDISEKYTMRNGPKFKETIDTIKESLGKLELLKVKPDFDTVEKEVNETLKKAKEDVEALKEPIEKAFDSVKKSSGGLSENIDKFNKAFEATSPILSPVLKQLERIKEITDGLKPFEFVGPKPEPKAGAAVEPLQDRIFVGAFAQAEEASNAITQDMEEIARSLFDAGIQAQDIPFFLGIAFDEVNNEAIEIGTNLNNSIVQAQFDAFVLQDIFANISNIAANIRIPQQAAPVAQGEAFAAGGFVNSGPFGIDKVPAWLTRGEFVLNKDATSKFYSQAVMMNRGVTPKFFNQGGYVGSEMRSSNVSNSLTNVGGVTINLQTNQTNPDVLARDLAQRMDREIRRGNIKRR